MTFKSIREVKSQLSSCIEQSQEEGIIITNHGKPEAVILGVAGYDAADVLLMASPKFWKMIETRRRQPTTRLEDFERELAKEVPPRPKARLPKRKRK